MAVHYFDSSALVKRYVSETGSAWVLTLVGPTSSHQNYVARISGAEVVAAVAGRQRAGSRARRDLQEAGEPPSLCAAPER